MYRLFVKKCKDDGKEACKFSTYSYIFNTNFNIGFFIPKKDQCSFCEVYNNSIESEKLKLENEKHKHKLETELSRNEKQNDKDLAQSNKNTIMVACYDLQSVLTTPSAQVSNFYYSRKFATYNLTIYDMGISEAHCYLWNEDQAKRGANEITTCVYQFLIENCLNKETIFYSDNCSGQQKNKFMATLNLYAVTYLNIPSITHKYLIVGHTQNEGDSVHSVIEKQKTRILKGGSIYSPQQWVTVIQSAKKTGKPFKVHELNYENFINFKQLTSNIGNNFNKNTLGQKVLWNDLKVIKVSKKHPDRLFYKTSYEQLDFGEIIVMNKTRNAKKKSDGLKLSKLYSEPPGISKEKKKDLIQLCDNKLIPENYQYFFKQLKVSNSYVTETNDESSD